MSRSVRTLVVPMVCFVLASVLLLPAAALAQQPSPTSEYQYRKDYAQVEGIMKETDAEKRADALLAFIKEHPQSRMIPYVSGYYSQIVGTHQQAGNWAKVIAMNEAFLALVPDDKTATTGLLGAYFQTQKYDKAAEIGEKLYAENPDKGLAFLLTRSYMQLQNNEKFLPYAEKTIAEFPLEQVYDLYLPVAGIYAAKKDLPKAAEYAAKLMNAYGDKLPQGQQEANWNASRAYAYTLMGASAYEKKEYAKAIESYEKVAVYSPQNDEPYYFIGMSKWRGQDLEGAMASFAKAAVLNKPYAKRAKDYLEQLYKPLHNDSLDGLEEVLAKARSELGIS